MLIFACLLVAAPLARAEEDVDEKDVFVLTDKNFNETIAKHKFALVRNEDFRYFWSRRNKKPTVHTF